MGIFGQAALTSLLIAVVIGKVNTEDADDDVLIFVGDIEAEMLTKLSVNDTHIDEIGVIPISNPTSMTFDPVEEQFYWFDRLPSGSIKRTDINGEHVTTIAYMDGVSLGLVIDEVSRRLLYSHNGVIKAMDLTSLKSQTILGSSHPYYVLINYNNKRIIWTEAGIMIRSSNYDGSDIKTIADNSEIIEGVTIDEDNDLIYWTQYSPGFIQVVSLDGTNKRVFYEHHSTGLLDLFLFDRTLYFTVHHQRVHRIPVDGGIAEEIPSGTVFDLPIWLYVHPKKHSTMYTEEKPKVESRLIHTENYHSELVFMCTFSQHSEDVFYSTSWFVEEKLVLSLEPEKWSNGSVIENQVLTETHLRKANITTYGIQISCSVEATLEEGNVLIPSVMSRKKFVGIQVSTTSVRVTQGASTDIKLSLTDPFGCGSFTHVDECRLRVKVNTLRKPDQCDQAVMMPSECGASFVASRWNESVFISLFGKVTSTYGSSSKEVNLNLTSTFNWAHQMWGEALLPQIQVQLTKDTSHIEEKSCYSNNDPHLKTFDGRRYEHQYDGNFTFYKHMDLPIEVQIQTARCSYSQNAWCNCGVAVRAGRTVFEINRCPGQSDIWFIDYTLCDDGGDVLQVKRRANLSTYGRESCGQCIGQFPQSPNVSACTRH